LGARIDGVVGKKLFTPTVVEAAQFPQVFEVCNSLLNDLIDDGLPGGNEAMLPSRTSDSWSILLTSQYLLD
jgi:hypothetical protein